MPAIVHPSTSSNPSMAAKRSGFMVLHANRLEDLRELLISFVKSQPLPPLQAEVILVQSNGMKHWLELALADDAALGICAATRMELPSSFLWQIYRSVLGADSVPHHMPFDKNSLLWRLMRLLPELAEKDAVYAPLKQYLSGSDDDRRLYQLAQQIADVLDGYQSYRADWLSDWADDKNLLRSHDGKAQTLPSEHAWQAQLWRDIRADVGLQMADASRSAVHAKFMARVREMAVQATLSGEIPRGIPPRIIVFGISSLSMQTLEALAALGQLGQVLMMVQNPCQYFWGDIVEGHDQLRRQVRQRQFSKPSAATELQAQATHPLLASWGKQGRDFLHLLDGFDRPEDYRSHMHRVDAFVDPETQAPALPGLSGPTQLMQLQSAIFNLEPVPPEPGALQPGDDSIILVTTHSAQREVEVLHDFLLTWFEAEPHLQPQDVMVMVPDMESFAPHIHAVFGRFSRGVPRHIPYSVADTTARHMPEVQALEWLLSLPSSRVSLNDWLGLFEVAAIRNRFKVSSADVEQLQNWLAVAGVRWGLNGEHRQAWGIPAEVNGLDQNTWAFGVRRLLLGYAVGQGPAWHGTLPQPAIRSLDAALVSKLLASLDALEITLNELSGDKTPARWCAVMEALAGRFFEATDDAQQRLLQRVLEPLEVWQKECDDAGFHAEIALDVVREHWLSLTPDGSLNQQFFGGGVQFGTLMPMRSIPFQVVCLLGMNDGDYPRQTAPRDFDLMAQSWRAGDRSRREDDRYLFLEAMLSARARLYISWQGHRVTDNTELPPSVLVAQLMDYLNAGWLPGRTPQRQPLQPYSEAYFLQDSPFTTYDKEWSRVHDGGQAAALPGFEATVIAVSDQRMPPPERAGPPSALTLRDLTRLVRQPVQVFFQDRLKVRFEEIKLAQLELEPFSLNHLEHYKIGQSVLEADDPERRLAELSLSGNLPMAAFGQREVSRLGREAKVLLERRSAWLEKYPFVLPAQSVSLEPGGTSLTGTLSGLWSNAEVVPDASNPLQGKAFLQLQQRPGAVTESTLKMKHARGHLNAGLWVHHLAACASGMQLTSVQLGLDGEVVFEPMEQGTALATLQKLVSNYAEAWQRPLPVACETAWAYLQALAAEEKQAAKAPDKAAKPARTKGPHEQARSKFEDGYSHQGELTKSLYLGRVFDSYQDIADDLPHWAEAIYGSMAASAHIRHAEGGAE